MLCRKMSAYLSGLLTIVLCLWVSGFAAYGEPEERVTQEASSSATSYENSRNLIEAALKNEPEDLDDLKLKQDALKHYETAMNATLGAISLQQTAHNSLLVNPDADIKKIIQAQSENGAALANLSNLLKEIRSGMVTIRTRLDLVNEKLALNRNLLVSVRKEMPDNPITDKLIRQINTLDERLRAKRDILQPMIVTYEAAIEKMEDSHGRISELAQQFESIISQKKKEALFKRKTPADWSLDISVIDGLFVDVPAQIVSRLKNDYQKILEIGYLRVTGVAIFIVIVLVAMFRLKRKMLQWDKHHDFLKRYPWRHIAICMTSRSLPLGWTAGVLYFFAFVNNFYTSIYLSGVGFYVIFIWLWTRWGLYMVSLWNQTFELPIPKPLAALLGRLMRLLRCLTILSALMIWMYGRTNITSTINDIVFYTVLAAWAIIFNRKLRTSLPEISPPRSTARALSILAIIVVYLIPLGGIVINLSGYRVLSKYWMISWGITLSICLWSWLTFNLILEWQHHFRKTTLPVSAETEKNRSLQWFFIQISWLTWLWISMVSICFAWYFDKTEFIKSIANLMNLSLTLGRWNISLSNVIETAIVLLLTHMLTRVWPTIFQEKFLADSGMNAGLKSSITVITIYVIWTFGFLLAFNILGVGFKSMAVAIGGLSIGLAFGLQAIFNNFFSGIILLFERPIQVGDVIEVGGILGEVKKINVRATLIQTYDNASLLIPNSELVSGQVTNWSFKDFRIRRAVNVGVAYGSDVELVRKTLLEIADTVQDVYKYPKPVVLFTDFGDSALVFQLRVWTHMDNGLTVQTNIRFAIDREFREKDIEISFPQRDIHIRSVDAAEFKTLLSSDTMDHSSSDDAVPAGDTIAK